MKKLSVKEVEGIDEKWHALTCDLIDEMKRHGLRTDNVEFSRWFVQWEKTVKSFIRQELAQAREEERQRVKDDEYGLQDIKSFIRTLLSQSVQEAKAERDEEWMMGMYQMFGNSKGGRIGMAIISTLNTKEG